MEELNRKRIDRAVLVGLNADCFTKEETATETTLDELEALLNTAGGECAGKVLQNKHTPDPRSFIGEGKAEEVRQLVLETGANMVIFDNDLTPSQTRTLEDILKTAVLDRSALILDIFAQRAKTREGKLQVELAQLAYRMPRLTGFGKSLSRLGGGIGTRGPGEKKLETDRRHIERRMYDIKSELAQLKNTRSVQRARREKSSIPVVALVGYTNSGKSALMNRILALTEKEEKTVFEKNMLFATLDTQQRSVVLDTNHQFILVDTVGFVSKLPHSLVEAFKATLEEVVYADLLVHVVDSAFENYDFQIEVTNKVLAEIGAGDKEKIMAYNKIDLVSEDDVVPQPGAENLFISAKYGEHIDGLLEKIKQHIFKDEVSACLLVPYSKGEVSSYLCEKSKVNTMEYREDGTYFEVELKAADYQRLKEYEVK